MASRPLIQMTVVELAKLAEGGVPDRELVINELRFRTTQAARRLLAKLESGGAAETPIGDRASELGLTFRAGRRSRLGRADRPVHGADQAGGSPAIRETAASESLTGDPCGDLAVRYAALRATFTLEGEILARWGMSEGMPSEIETHVFTMWRDLLGKSLDRRGRTLKDLDADVSRLAAERGHPSPVKGTVRFGR